MKDTKTAATEFAWLIRREVWEHRLVTWGPAILAGLILLSALTSVIKAHHSGVMFIDGDSDLRLASMPQARFDLIVGGALFGITLLFLMLANALQFFYAADTLYSERAQRTILFWKSMPVSDLDTVLSKLVVAAIVMPVIALIAAVGTEIVLALLVGIQFRSVPGVINALADPAVWWHTLSVSLYVLVTSALWYLPVVGWMLLVSAWMPVARGMRFGRSPMLVAILIPVAVMVVEAIALHTNHVYRIVMERVTFAGYFRALPRALETQLNGDDWNDMHVNSTLGAISGALVHPLDFLATPSVWIGIVLCVPMVAAAVHCRRGSENRG